MFVKKQWWRQGSFTVEAAVIVPLLALLVAALIALCFHAHDRAWYTGAACEAALAANASDDPVGTAEERVRRRLEEHILPGELPLPEVSAGKQGTGVAFSGRRNYGLPWDLPRWEADVYIRRVRPAGTLRNWWAAKRFGKELLDQEED